MISLIEVVQLAIELTVRAEQAEAKVRALEAQLAQALEELPRPNTISVPVAAWLDTAASRGMAGVAGREGEKNGL